MLSPPMQSNPQPTPSSPRLVWVVIGGLVLTLLAAFAGWKLGSRHAAVSEQGMLKVGNEAPDFSLDTLDGRSLGPAQFRGQKIVLVDFWATWCGPCRIQRQILEPLYDEFHGRGVEFLAVSVGEDGQTVRDFLNGNPFAYPVLIDPDDKIGSQLQIDALPTLMVVDRQGRIAYVHIGIADQDELRSVLKEAGAA